MREWTLTPVRATYPPAVATQPRIPRREHRGRAWFYARGASTSGPTSSLVGTSSVGQWGKLCSGGLPLTGPTKHKCSMGTSHCRAGVGGSPLTTRRPPTECRRRYILCYAGRRTLTQGVYTLQARQGPGESRLTRGLVLLHQLGRGRMLTTCRVAIPARCFFRTPPSVRRVFLPSSLLPDSG